MEMKTCKVCKNFRTNVCRRCFIGSEFAIATKETAMAEENNECEVELLKEIKQQLDEIIKILKNK